MTINGKLDRSALPTIVRQGDDPVERRQPGTDVEVLLADVWADVLDLEVASVGVDDNFFALGGDSLLAVEVVAEAAARGLAITVSALFRSQTIGELATQVGLDGPGADHGLEPFSLLSPADNQRLRELDGVTDAMPMTALQLAMVFHSTATAGTTVYQNVMQIDVEDAFDHQRLSDALAAVIARHPMLRARFALAGFDEPLMIIEGEATLPVTVRRVAGAEERQRAASDWTTLAKDEAPDFDNAPLLKVHVIADADAFTACWRIHHTIMDGWSDALFISELIGGYLDGAAPGAPEPTSTFAEHVRGARLAAESKSHTDFWRGALRASKPTHLPRPVPAEDRPTFPKLLLTVPGSVSLALRDHSSRWGVPVKSLYMGAFAATVEIRTGATKPTIGLVVNARPESARGTSAIGLFLNTVPVTFDTPARRWVDWAMQAYDLEARLLPYRELPLVDILRGATAPPFGAVFNFVRFTQLETLQSRSDVRVSDIRSWDETDFPFLINVVDALDHTVLEVSYRTDQVSTAEATVFGSLYLEVLDSLARDPEVSLSPAPDPEVSVVHDAIEAIVRESPDAIAIRHGSDALTYAELWSWSGKVAALLGRAGVGPGEIVPVLVGRRTELIVAALGVLRAGAGYVLLEPSWPRARLEEICQRIAPHALLATADRVEGFRGVSVVAVPDRAEPDLDGIGPAITNPDPDATMAIFFTSGSTGEPKGAVIPHRALHRLLGTNGPYAFDRDTEILSVCALPWDFATLEIWAPLTAGGVLHLPEHSVDAAVVTAAIADGVNTMILPTGLFHSFADEVVGLFDGLRTCLVGGESLSVRHARKVLQAHPDLALFNVYGPVETCGGSTYQRVTADDLTRDSVPLGSAVPGDVVRVVDSALREVPAGVVGEIVISGSGLGRGYLDDLQATADKFVTMPSPDGPGRDGVRAYRTGDLGVRGASGTLTYHGRRDRQVKVMGIRTELGEVESYAQQVDGVDRAVALPLPWGSDRPDRLVMFYTGDTDAGALRGHLADKLPGQAVPKDVLHVEDFPLTMNGKTDLDALAKDPRIAPDTAGEATPGTRVVEPVDDIDRSVIRHARRILERDGTQLDDDFFNSGGNSLHAIRLTAALSQELRTEIPVVVLLSTRRLNEFAQAIRTQGTA